MLYPLPPPLYRTPSNESVSSPPAKGARKEKGNVVTGSLRYTLHSTLLEKFGRISLYVTEDAIIAKLYVT